MILENANQPTLPTLEPYAPGVAVLPKPCQPLKKLPPERRVDWVKAAERAGQLEKMVAGRLREVLQAGDITAARLLAGTYKEVAAAVLLYERKAQDVISTIRMNERLRAAGIE